MSVGSVSAGSIALSLLQQAGPNPGPQRTPAAPGMAKPAGAPGLSLSENARSILARNSEAMATIHRLVEQSAAAKVPGSKLAEAGAAGSTRLVPLSPGGTPSEAGSKWGDPTMTDEEFFKAHVHDSMLSQAEAFDKNGYPPEVGNALRAAAAKGAGAVTVQKASEVPDLNTHYEVIYTSNGLGMDFEWTRNPTGEPKAAMDAGKAFWMWTESRGTVYVTW